jgi:hypothetical protein
MKVSLESIEVILTNVELDGLSRIIPPPPVTSPVAVSVVAAIVSGVVPPIGPGLAKSTVAPKPSLDIIEFIILISEV